MVRGASALVLRRRAADGATYEYLFQHRAAGVYGGAAEFGAGMLGLPGGRARKTDRGAVETAWREAVEEGALPADLPLSAVVPSAVVQVFRVPPHHTLVVVDADRLPLARDWVGDAAAAPDAAEEVAMHVWPTGHVWVSEPELETLLTGGCLRDGVRLWPAVADTLKRHRAALGFGAGLLLYHGTTMDGARSIFSNGFRVASACTGACRRRRGAQAACQCGMLGYGVYLGDADKAASNAGRAAGAVQACDASTGALVGAVIECHVNLGRTCVADPHAACACQCRRPGVDHGGVWQRHADSVFLAGGGPAAKRSEWCVADPRRVTPLRARLVHWTQDRQLISTGAWMYL